MSADIPIDKHEDHPSKVRGVFEKYLSEFHANIYDTARSLFPCPELDEMYVELSHEMGSFHGGEIPLKDGTVIPGIIIGMKPEPDSKNLLPRIESRFGISAEVLADPQLGILFAKLVILAHELGHVIQMNSGWQAAFGGIADGYHLPDSSSYTPEEYQSYVTSESEGNADYIAAKIVATSLVGPALDVASPEQDCTHWREWVEAHPVRLPE